MKRKILVIMTLAVLLTPALAFCMASFDFPVVQPVVSFVAGDVTVKGAGSADWEEATVGRLLASGDTVRTGPASKAEISCATGKMRMYENTVIIVPEVVDEGDKKDIRSVTLEDGSSLFNIRKRGVEKGFEVKTSNIIAGVKGTLYGVLHKAVTNVTRVAVYKGIVEVSDPERSPGTTTQMGKGQSMEVQDQKGFGDTEDFEPGDVWDLWEKISNPNPDFLAAVPGRFAPAAASAFFETEGELITDEGCPPVVDNDGNLVIQ